jgi:hypothetical protein
VPRRPHSQCTHTYIRGRHTTKCENFKNFVRFTTSRIAHYSIRPLTGMHRTIFACTAAHCCPALLPFSSSAMLSSYLALLSCPVFFSSSLALISSSVLLSYSPVLLFCPDFLSLLQPLLASPAPLPCSPTLHSCTPALLHSCTPALLPWYPLLLSCYPALLPSWNCIPSHLGCKFNSVV